MKKTISLMLCSFAICFFGKIEATRTEQSTCEGPSTITVENYKRGAQEKINTYVTHIKNIIEFADEVLGYGIKLETEIPLLDNIDPLFEVYSTLQEPVDFLRTKFGLNLLQDAPELRTREWQAYMEELDMAMRQINSVAIEIYTRLLEMIEKRINGISKVNVVFKGRLNIELDNITTKQQRGEIVLLSSHLSFLLSSYGTIKRRYEAIEQGRCSFTPIDRTPEQQADLALRRSGQIKDISLSARIDEWIGQMRRAQTAERLR